MFTLDELGLAGMSEKRGESFLQHAYDELAHRVGVRLTAGMTDAQLNEFESILDGDATVIVAWLTAHRPDFDSDPHYLRVAKALGPDAPVAHVLTEYASSAWLAVNRPDYKSVVAEVTVALRDEILRNRAAILG